MNHSLLLALFFSIAVSAELAPLMDSDSSQIDGQNGAEIGIIWNDVYAIGEDTTLTLDFDSGAPYLH
ncbi:MAG: hypothetical protein ACJAR6_000750 [Oleispira sp.]|jgi:hypothetical protein